MKISARKNENAKNNYLDMLWKFNEPLLIGVKNRFHLSELPGDLITQVKTLGKRFSKVVPLEYEDFDDRYPGIAILRDKSAIKLDDVDRKTGMPILFIYTPVIDQELKEQNAMRISQRNAIRDMTKKSANAEKIGSRLQKAYGIKPTFEFKEFIKSVLPADMPIQTYFDGSKKRVANLAMQKDAVLYGNSDDSIFAVEHMIHGMQTLTFFVEEIDYVSVFAKKLENRLDIEPALAMKISSSLKHDVYYAIHDSIFSDAERFAINMARLLKCKEGDTVFDLAQQREIEIIHDEFTGKLMLDIDDELPSAVLIGNRINLYLPE